MGREELGRIGDVPEAASDPQRLASARHPVYNHPPMSTESSPSTPGKGASAVDVVLALYEAIDTGHATEAGVLFTDDAVFDHPEQVFRGIEEIRGFLSRRESDTDRRTIHVLNNTRIAEADEGEREVSSVVFIYSPDAGGDWHLHRVARMRHVVRAVDGQWRITSRVIGPADKAMVHQTR